MSFKWVFAALLASALTVFALQNGASTKIRFLFWTLEAASLAMVILLSAAVGIVLVGLPLWLDRWRLRGRVRALEARLDAVERSAGPARGSG